MKEHIRFRVSFCDFKLIKVSVLEKIFNKIDFDKNKLITFDDIEKFIGIFIA
jgi:hypothetical protein